MKYSINLVRTLREQERRQALARRRTSMLVILCLVSLALAIGYNTLHVVAMRSVIAEEHNKLARIDAEYKQYKATTLIVDKADIELLDKLQNDRIFWTRKLAAMAVHLPENYWVTKFGYGKANTFQVDGYGYITKAQKQLITLDDYLNLLRADSLFNDDFKTTHLDLAKRDDEGSRERVNFEYSAYGRNAKR